MTTTASPVSAADMTAELYGRYGRSLRSYTESITGDRQRGEDLVQETLLRAWQNADRLVDHEAGRRAWLFRVARNVAIDEVRYRKARPAEVYVEPVDQVRDPSDDVVASIEMVRMLRCLSPEHRSVLIEIFYIGRTTREAARALRIPHGTAKSRLHYGLRRLREQFPARDLAS